MKKGVIRMKLDTNLIFSKEMLLSHNLFMQSHAFSVRGTYLCKASAPLKPGQVLQIVQNGTKVIAESKTGEIELNIKIDEKNENDSFAPIICEKG